jgi:hypothetical protein
VLLDRVVKVPLGVALPLGAVVALTGVGCLVFVLARSRWAGRVAGALLIAAAAWWEMSNAPVEGKVLIAVARGHGLRMADVIAFQAGIIGLALVVGPRRPVQRRHSAASRQAAH